MQDRASELFERAADAVVFGDLEGLRSLLDQEPALVHARSARQHRATLLHYCAANGTEDPRQRTPDNAPAIARLLLERGADPTAVCPMYGNDTVLGLLLTSAIPDAAGLDGELVRELVRGGLRVNASDMFEAIVYARPRSVDALAEAGVPIDNLLFAAATDRTDLLEGLLAQGADVDTRFTDNWTALHAAAVSGRVRATELLLARGADASVIEERFDGTAAGNARYNGRIETAELIERWRRH
ncbi:MAG TPA: ankyrin repeat domain-containing protein [Polyangiales bacterium]|nr:ankyrin repeat domain-containing protein [Polyangiales bacterium]